MNYTDSVTNVKSFIRKVNNFNTLYEICDIHYKVESFSNISNVDSLKKLREYYSQLYSLIETNNQLLNIIKIIENEKLNTISSPKYAKEGIEQIYGNLELILKQTFNTEELDLRLLYLNEDLGKVEKQLRELLFRLSKGRSRIIGYNENLQHYRKFINSYPKIIKRINKSILLIIKSLIMETESYNLLLDEEKQLFLDKIKFLENLEKKYNMVDSEIDKGVIFLDYIKKFSEELEDSIYDAELNQKRTYMKYLEHVLDDRILDKSQLIKSDLKILVINFNKIKEESFEVIKIGNKKIKSYKEFINFLSEKYKLFYRGQSSLFADKGKDFSIVPSLMHRKEIVKNEYTVFQDILRLDNDAFDKQKSYLDIHKEMQHYAEISRVIDITTQALTGLFFAIGELTEVPDTDPYVFMFSVEKGNIKRPESDGTQIKLALSTIKDNQRADLVEALTKYKEKKINRNQFNKEESVKKLCYAVRRNDRLLTRITEPNHIADIEFVLPNMNNKRIVAQQGAFIAVGLLDKDGVYDKIRPYLEIPGLSELMMIKIDKNHAYDMKIELENLGISKSVMYPDIQKIGQYFKHDYYIRN